MHFDVDLQKCVACAACTVACMDQNDTDITNGERPLRYMYQMETKGNDGGWHVIYMSAACMHCSDCTAMIVCPKHCFSRDTETGFIQLNNTECIHCGRCVRACTFGAVQQYSDKSIHKCDGCIERVKFGLKPACIHACPTGALCLLPDDQKLQEEHSLFANPELLKKSKKWE